MGCQSLAKQSSACTPQIVMEQRTLGVEILPGKSVPRVEKGVNHKYLEYVRYMSKFWRLCQLAVPKYKHKKFVSCDEKGDSKKLPVKLPDHVHFYCENLAVPSVRVLEVNRNLFGKLKGKKWKRGMRRNILKSWGTIYNFYNRRKMIQARLLQKRLKQEKKAKHPKRNAEQMKTIYGRLATPKQPPKPEKKKEKKKRDVDYERISEMAKPKEVPDYVKPVVMPISPNALKYIATPTIIRLAQEPARYQLIKKPLQLPRPIPMAAKKYVATERIKEMTKPLERHCDGKLITYEPEEKNTDAFKVSPKALTYKITARMKKLAEPKEAR